MIMKHIHFTTLRLLLGVFALGLLATSCINEDLDACYKLTLKVVNTGGENITASGDVSDATIYVFDESNNFVETVKMSVDAIRSSTPITLKTPYRADKKLYFVAWGNIASGDVIITEGQKIADFKAQLRSDNGVASQPSDLFGGHKMIITAQNNLKQNEEIVIEPKVGGVTLRTEGLPNYQKNNPLRSDDNFAFSVDKTSSEYNYEGNLQGDLVFYEPEGQMTADQEFATPLPHSVFPGDKLAGSLFLDGETIGFDDKDENGNDINVGPHQQKEFVFVFGDNGAFLGIRVIVRPWGYVPDDIEW